MYKLQGLNEEEEEEEEDGIQGGEYQHLVQLMGSE